MKTHFALITLFLVAINSYGLAQDITTSEGLKEIHDNVPGKPGSYKYGEIDKAFRDGVRASDLELKNTSNGLVWEHKQPTNTDSRQPNSSSSSNGSYGNSSYSTGSNRSGVNTQNNYRSQQIALKKEKDESARQQQIQKDKQFQQNKSTVNAGFKSLRPTESSNVQQSKFRILGQSSNFQNNQNQIIAQRLPQRPLPNNQISSSVDERKNNKLDVIKMALNSSTNTPKNEGVNVIGQITEKTIAYINPEFSEKNEYVIKRVTAVAKEQLSDIGNNSEIIKNIEDKLPLPKESTGQQLKTAIWTFGSDVAEKMGYVFNPYIDNLKTKIESVIEATNKTVNNTSNVYKDGINPLMKKPLPSAYDYDIYQKKLYESFRQSQNEINKENKKIITKSN